MNIIDRQIGLVHQAREAVKQLKELFPDEHDMKHSSAVLTCENELDRLLNQLRRYRDQARLLL